MKELIVTYPGKQPLHLLIEVERGETLEQAAARWLPEGWIELKEKPTLVEKTKENPILSKN